MVFEALKYARFSHEQYSNYNLLIRITLNFKSVKQIMYSLTQLSENESIIHLSSSSNYTFVINNLRFPLAQTS